MIYFHLHRSGQNKNSISYYSYVTELHGSNWLVKCVSCHGWTSHRGEFQERLKEENPGFKEAVETGHGTEVVRPDGDVDLPKVRTDGPRN